MKKKFSLLAVTLLTLSLVLAGCSSSSDKKTDTKKTTIGFVTDTGGIDDKSFNQSTYEGIKRFVDESTTTRSSSYIQSKGDADYESNLTALVDSKNDLIVAAGYLFDASMATVSKKFPDSKFLVIDTVVANSNVVSATFAAEQGSFLVGVAAALKAKEMGKTKVGFIGGMESELIISFESGFAQGVKAVDATLGVEVEYAGAFDNAAAGQTIASKMYSSGISIIYHAAGGTGAGAIKEARERAAKNEEVYVIGVDRDQYADGIYSGEKSVILTSMLKRVDNVAYDVSKTVEEGKFEGGKTLTYDLKNNGVGIPDKNPNLSDEIVAQVKAYAEKIKSGEITVKATR